MADKKIKVAGYAKKVTYNGNIEYRNFSEDLVGFQLASNGGTPLFTMGNFSITTNLDPKTNKNFVTNNFSSFTSLDDLNLTLEQTKALLTNNAGVILNLDKTQLKYYATFGSLSEFVRVSLEDIITKWPASLFLYPSTTINGDSVNGVTFQNYTYDYISNTATFSVPTNFIVNKFEINYLTNGTIADSFSATNDLRNLTVNYSSYVILFNEVEYPVLGFTGSTNVLNDDLFFTVSGDPFSGQPNTISYHIKPNKTLEETFFNTLEDFQYYLLNRLVTPLYTAKFSYPIKSESGLIIYVDKTITWPVSDGYNIDFDSPEYLEYATELFDLAYYNDLYTSNLMNRFLVTESITDFDTQPIILADEHMDSSGQKVNKTLNIYGQEFDEINKFITGIEFAHTVSYDKLDNVPDIYLKDLAKTLGWDLISSVAENDLLTNYVKTSKSTYSGQSVGLTAVEADVELWRRLILNSPWIWKSKGTRKTIEFLLRFIGTPQGLVQFNEYVYTSDKPIDIDMFLKVLELNDLDTDLSLYPIDSEGYPLFLPDTDDMYFQSDGLWYRETGGPDSVIDILTGNNPHVGKYDGGYRYINQLRELIPNFSAVTITAETITTGITHLFTNYGLGLIDNYTGDTYVDVINNDGTNINKDIHVYSSIIDDPRPSKVFTPCGCDCSGIDNSLSVCIETKNIPPTQPCESLANQPTKDVDNGWYVFQKYQYNQDGSVYTQNSVPVLSTGIFIDKECCTGLNGVSSYNDVLNKSTNDVSSGYACCHSNICGCSLACDWNLTGNLKNIDGYDYLDFRTLFGTGQHKITSPDVSNCPTRWSTAIPNITDPYTGDIGFGCKINSLGVSEFSTMINYFIAKANGGIDTAKCCAFTPELYLSLIAPPESLEGTSPPIVYVPPVTIIIPSLPQINCRKLLTFDYSGNGGPSVFKFKLCNDTQYSYHTFNLAPSISGYATYQVGNDTGFPYDCILENSMELVSGDITITNNRYIYSSTVCTWSIITTPSFRAWHFSNPGRNNSSLACNNTNFTNVFYTDYQVGNYPMMGSQLYLDSTLQSKVGSGNLWYNSKEAYIDEPTAYRINNSGILIESKICGQ